MYATLPSFALGFHGCDRSVVESVASGRDVLRPSENDYDWLGHGVYFWENDPERAFRYAQALATHPRRSRSQIHEPAALGAVIDFGRCLNLMEAAALDLVRDAYDELGLSSDASDIPLPENTDPSESGDLLLRRLDCAVLQFLCNEFVESRGLQPFDTVRGLFFEGGELYPGAGFREKNHIQVCVRNPNCIKGFFLPRAKDSIHLLP